VGLSILPGVKPGVALPADDLVAVVLLGQQAQGGFDHSTAQAQNLHMSYCRPKWAISLLNHPAFTQQKIVKN